MVGSGLRVYESFHKSQMEHPSVLNLEDFCVWEDTDPSTAVPVNIVGHDPHLREPLGDVSSNFVAYYRQARKDSGSRVE